jgi:hypothetical protein
MKMISWKLAVAFAFSLLSASLAAQALPDSPEPTGTNSARTGPAAWVRVQELVNGEAISVTQPGAPSVRCRFAGATSDSLFCDSFYGEKQYRFNRVEVERVRSDDKRRNVRIVVGALTAAGFTWGVTEPPSSHDGIPRFLAGFAGAGLGAITGVALALPTALLIPGKLIYRHSRRDGNSPTTATSAEQAPAPSGPRALAP